MIKNIKLHVKVKFDEQNPSFHVYFFKKVGWILHVCTSGTRNRLLINTLNRYSQLTS